MLSNTIFVFLIKVISAFASFGSNIILVRYLGSDISGGFFYYQTAMMFLSALFSFGCYTPTVRCIAQGFFGEIKGLGVFRSSLKLIMLTSFTFSLIVFLSNKFLSYLSFSDKEIFILLVASFLFAINSLCYSVIQGKGNVVVSTIFQTLFFNILISIYVIIYDNISFFKLISIYTFLISLAIFIQILFLKYKDKAFWRRLRFDVTNINTIVRLSIPCLVIIFSERIVPLIIQTSLNDNSNITYFTILLRIIGVLTIVISSVNIVLSRPIAISYKNNKINEIKKMTSYSFLFFLFVSISYMLIVLNFSELILGFFGENYVNIKYHLIIISFAQCINIMTGSVSFLLTMTGNEKHLRNSVILALFAIIIYVYLYIEDFDLLNAVITYSIYILVSNIYAWYQVNKVIGINTLRFYYDKN